jgi:hypothetical protein
MTSFTFRCVCCGELQTGMPTFGATAPDFYFTIPEEEAEDRCELDTDHCIIDSKHFFVRGCLEIPVHGAAEPFIWGVWVSLSQQNFDAWQTTFGVAKRAHVGPFFGWLDAVLKPYPSTLNLKTMVHLRDDGIRPNIVLEPTDHPLAIEQREGISVDRLSEIYTIIMHGKS